MSIQPLTSMFHKSENIRISQYIRHQQNDKYNKKGSDDDAEHFTKSYPENRV